MLDLVALVSPHLPRLYEITGPAHYVGASDYSQGFPLGAVIGLFAGVVIGGFTRSFLGAAMGAIIGAFLGSTVGLVTGSFL